MSISLVYTAAGPLELGKRIGRGGEGEVFSVADGSGRVVKLYLKPDAERQAKVAAMISAGLSARCPHAAFPVAAVFNTNRSFAGFVMQGFADRQPLHQLYSPASRRKLFPNADFRFLVRTALNLARAVAKVQDAGVVIGDINHSSVLVGADARVALIDADSMQIDEHRCRVGVPEYTSPELQGRPLGGIVRTKEHDAFGLAVLLFQMLFLGRHPYAGVTRREMPLAQAIATNRFAWSRIFDNGVAPPPNSLLLTDMPVHVRVAFERAFGRDPRARPDSSAWAMALAELEQLLVPCSRDHHHHRLLDMACAWCRMDRNGTAAIFCRCKPSPGSRPTTGDALFDNAQHELRKVRKLLAKQLEPAGRTNWCPPSDTVRAFVQDHRLEHSRLKLNLPAGGVVSQDRFTSAYLRSRDELEATLSDWRRRIGLWDLEELAAKIERRMGELRRLEQLVVGDLVSDSANARAAFVAAALRAAKLSETTIPGISRQRLQELAKQFETATDINKHRFLRAPGLGSVRRAALLLWRDEVESGGARAARIRYPAEPQARDSGRENARVRVARCREKLEPKLGEAKLLRKKITNSVMLVEPTVSAARKAVAARHADILYLKLPLP